MNDPVATISASTEGSVAEWSIATVLKTVGSQGPVSSNLTASANSQPTNRQHAAPRASQTCSQMPRESRAPTGCSPPYCAGGAAGVLIVTPRFFNWSTTICAFVLPSPASLAVAVAMASSELRTFCAACS